MSKNIRAVVPNISGLERYEIIKSVISRVNLSIEHSYFLEATSLIESLICDRLESRLGELLKKPIAFSTIGNLLFDLKKYEKEIILLDIMQNHIIDWAKDRNIVIHQAAKIEVGHKKDWNLFLKFAEKTAKNGIKIFNLYNSNLKKVRRKKV